MQEEFEKWFSELCDQKAERIHFQARHGDPKRVSADDEERDLTDMS
jgi:hypothetical protein